MRNAKTRTHDSQLDLAVQQSRQTTLAALTQVDDSTLQQLSRLTLPEIQAIKEQVAQIFPAGNLLAFVLIGLTKLKGRELSPKQVSQDVTALLRGIDLIPHGLYSVFFAGPAAALYAYQKLLQLAGKDSASAFPQGTWQFYLQFALREDTARHANETIGFQQALAARSAGRQQPHSAIQAAAWVCAILELIYRYDDLLAADWSERVMLRLLQEEATAAKLADEALFAAAVERWNGTRPYHRPADGSDYLYYRQTVFQPFLNERLAALPQTAQKRFHQRYQARQSQELAHYQEQMTILAALDPERYQEHRQAVPLWQAMVAFIWQGHCYLLPVCQKDEHGSPLCFPAEPAGPMPLYMLDAGKLCDAKRRAVWVDRSGRVLYRDDGQTLGRLRPPTPEAVLGWLDAILATPAGDAPPMLDLLLAESPRALQAQLRDKLPPQTRAELASLRCAPVVLNWDGFSYELPLAYIRRGRRGIGDHALTVLRTDWSMVFDQSHIFFDGMWGLAVAEILTDGAVHWQRHVEWRSASPPSAAPVPLALSSAPEVEAMVQAEGRTQPQWREVAAESTGIDMPRLARLRKWLNQRGTPLTVNDLMILYRFLHASRYKPSASLARAIKELARRTDSPDAVAAYESIRATLLRLQEMNPALLIPMDASNVSPKERVFPTTFRNPLTELDVKFKATQERYVAYRSQSDAAHWRSFDRARREFLAYLKAFGQLLDTLKAVTMRGESFNTATIRLLAHLPASMQRLLDQIPQHIGVLNEIVKGNEVFSNTGRVTPGSSLTRFISAKDDGQTKEMVWGILTNAQGQMVISLRDFRPFVPMLLAIGEATLANMLAQDYLESYVKGFNRFAAELSAIISLKSPPPTK